MKSPITHILPVVVLYRVHLEETTVYQTLLSKGDFAQFMVYDNSPADFLQTPMPEGVIYVRDTANSGLSRAYNTAADYAREEGFTHVLLLDQDTWFPPCAAACYAAADRKCRLWAPSVRTLQGRPLSPTVQSWSGVRATRIPPGKYSLKKYYVINSGICVDVYTFGAAGGYKTDVRLDFADFQFLERFKQVDANFQLLRFEAVQDFSNDIVDEAQLFRRFKLYVESFRACRFNTRLTHLRHFLGVLRHTLHLTLRTRSLTFLRHLFSVFRANH
ncbi:MAG: glycosyltransferase [Bacteroidales bacterium]|nr:glycosyltransferase [Bacteroidales bacterium]